MIWIMEHWWIGLLALILGCPVGLIGAAISTAMVNQGQRGREVSSVAPEVLIINGPSFAQEAGLFEEMEAMGCK